jgi:chromosome segregation ATPase
MSDLRKHSDAATKTIEQSTALRGWLTALLAQTVQAETTIRYRLADLETEAQRLRTHQEQTTSAIETLRRSINTVDEAIGRRFRELQTSLALDRRSETAELESERHGESPEHAPRAPPHESRQARRHRQSE